jgi:hypothetical protein
MKSPSIPLLQGRAPGASPRAWREPARAWLTRFAFLALIAGSALQLGGCRAVEAVFKVGVWFGVLIVVTLVAVTGGVLALVLKKKT